MFKNLITLFAVIFFVGGTIAQTNDDLYFVFMNTNPECEVLSDEKAEAIQAAHMQNIDKLAEDGKLFAAGPFEGGGGMFVLHAESLGEANGFLQSDPAVQANRFATEVFPFQLAHGNMCGAKEPYEMVAYQMVRFTNIDKNGTDVHKVAHDTRIFMADVGAKKKNIVAQGYFNDQADGILILDVETTKEAEKIFKKHPSVKSGKMTYDVKTLWIAKGVFCE